MHSGYQSPILKQLRDQQVRFAPRKKKLEQIESAEHLITEIDPKRNYTYEYLCFRITGYRPDSSPKFVAVGADVIRDLRLFIEDVSDAADILVEEAGEPVRTVDDLAKTFNVSTKTISRWRQQGLVSRRFIFDGRKRVGFLQSSVDRFVNTNRDRVRRGSQFSQLTETEREEIVRRARRLARAGGCPSDVTRRIAQSMNRSVRNDSLHAEGVRQKAQGLGDLPKPYRPVKRSSQRGYPQALSAGEWLWSELRSDFAEPRPASIAS